MQFKIKRFFTRISISVIFFLGSTFVASAQNTPPPVTGALLVWAKRFISVLMGLIVLGAVLTIIISAYRYMASTGNPEELKKSKEAILIAVLSVVLMFMAWGILSYLAPQLVPNFGSFFSPYRTPF